MKDVKKPTELARPSPADAGKALKDKVDALTKQLEKQGVDPDAAGDIASRLPKEAKGPISPTDWGVLDSSRFTPETKSSLANNGLTREVVMADDRKAEEYVGHVLSREGLPDGNGDVEQLKGVVPGHFDQRGHGIDQVAIKQDGSPVPLEVKRYQSTSGAAFEDRPIGQLKAAEGKTSELELEPAVERWRAEREQKAAEFARRYPEQVSAYRQSDDRHARPNSPPELQSRPDVPELRRDAARMVDHNGRLPIQQMDDLWTQDRWLKLARSEEGRQRLEKAGVDAKYLDYEKMSQSPGSAEWKTILDQRASVIVSDDSGNLGRHMTHQIVFERSGQDVYKIELKDEPQTATDSKVAAHTGTGPVHAGFTELAPETNPPPAPVE